jgi:hypothetical protein
MLINIIKGKNNQRSDPFASILSPGAMPAFARAISLGHVSSLPAPKRSRSLIDSRRIAIGLIA